MILLTSDTHFTSKPRDAYRFDLFPWLCQQVESFDIAAIIMLGDLVDAKDRHPSVLVNKVVKELDDLAARTTEGVWLLMGNHDYIDPNFPFFKFLQLTDGIRYVDSILKETIAGKELLFLPHTRHPEIDWDENDWARDLDNVDYVFMHHTFQGALASNGFPMEGLHTEAVFGRKKVEPLVFSGDIHVPQDIGPVTYVGSPYPINFGDDFDARVLLINDKDKVSELYFDTIGKWKINLSQADELHDITGLREGDQVKIKLLLHRSEFVEWSNHKRAIAELCEKMGLQLFGIELEEAISDTMEGKVKGEAPVIAPVSTPEESYIRFCEREGIDKYTAKVGRQFLDKRR